MKNSLVITKKEQLSLIFSNSGFDKIEVNLPNFNKVYNNYWTTKIEKAYKACGCKTGYNFMISGLIIALLYISLSFSSFIESPLISLGKLLLFTVFMAVLGKGLGLLIAKMRLRKYVEEINKSTLNF